MSNPLGGMTQVPVGPQPVQIMPPLGAGQQVTIINQDIVNVVSIGRSNNIAFNSGNTAPINPLTPITVDASKAIYAIAPAGTASVVVIPGGAEWSPSPAQVAAQIALANAAVTVVNQGSINLPTLVGGTGSAQQPVNLSNVNPVAMTGVGLIGSNISQYESYEFVLSMSAGQNASVGINKLTLSWYDAPTDTIPIDEVIWYVPCSFTNSPTTVWGHGQHRGIYMVAQLASLEVLGITPLNILNSARVTATQRPYQNDWASSTGIPQELLPTSASVYSNELLAISGLSIPASTSIIRGVFLYGGKVHLHAENRLAAGVLIGDLTDAAQTLDTIWHSSVPENAAGTGPAVDIDLLFPRKPMILTVTNTSAGAAGSLYASIIADRV